MSPSGSYRDGKDDGNSNWYDRNRFQNDNDYYDGVRDGWREKERRKEEAREEAHQKMLDRVDYDKYTESQSEYTYTSYIPTSHTAVKNNSKSLSCGAMIAIIVLSLVITVVAAPLWGLLSGTAFMVAPIIVFVVAFLVLISIIKNW